MTRLVRSSSLFACAIAALACISGSPSTTRAQDDGRRVEIRFVPTHRAQIAVWIESPDGARFATAMLTEATALRGVGNRPGAMQMNSGFHWPYGRREGVLPVWAHHRFDWSGMMFPRVVFNGRDSEGKASVSGDPGGSNTRDEYYCLSFDASRSGRDRLDAVSCASVFMSNKGRYLTADDVTRGYSEPFERTDGTSQMRGLTVGSLYPPRRDVTRCASGGGCADHADVGRFQADTLAVFPEIDAVSTATPLGNVAQTVFLEVPAEWPDGEYVAFVEINVEGDYGPGWDDSVYPTPRGPTGRWDSWAMGYGYPYRGQPSVVYRVPFEIGSRGGRWQTSELAGHGALEGEHGDIVEDDTIVDDPEGAPGSGADRLRMGEWGSRIEVTVPTTDVCAQPEPPPECGRECEPGEQCSAVLECSSEATCVDRCQVRIPPTAVQDLTLEPYREERHSHEWGHLSFRVPAGLRHGFSRFEVRFSTEEITEASFDTQRVARAATLEDIALTLPTAREDGSPLQPGDVISVDIGGMMPSTRYFVGVRTRDECNHAGPLEVVELTTTEIHFTTVSPCFVATAAYGSPLEHEVGALRRFRDRHLRQSALGAALVSVYETLGPYLADAIRDDEDARAWARWALEPLIELVD